MTAITDTGSLLEYLSKSALLSNIPSTKLSSLLENNPPRFAEAGEIIVTRNQEINEHLFLIDGEIEAQRIWSVSGKNDKSYTWNLEPNNDAPALLTAASNNLRVRAVSDIQYVLLNADKIDALLGWTNRSKQDKNKSNKIQLVQQIAITHHLPQSIMDKIVNELVAVEVEAGEVIIKEADKGDSYYMIEDGEAEVIRSDPFTGETSVVNQIGTGDCFGEEALIQDGFRNATIRMLTPGKLQVLSRKAFEKHIQSSLLNEISAEEAYQKINNKEVKLLDCRYDMEYEDCRIENAFLIPLHELREQTHQLKQDIHYLVYCRSGRRSKAAAYLLQERNFQATSIKGGIKDWPYEILYGEE